MPRIGSPKGNFQRICVEEDWSKKLTWKYEKLCGASVDKRTRHNCRNGGIFWGQQISGGHCKWCEISLGR
jgi:hypothetical protein